jgi:hypothetical protein
VSEAADAVAAAQKQADALMKPYVDQTVLKLPDQVGVRPGAADR